MKDYEYLSPGMEVLPSMQAMLGHMQREAGFTTRDVRNLEAKIRSIERTETKRTGEASLPPPPPLEEAALPGGWTKRKVGEASTSTSPPPAPSCTRCSRSVDNKYDGLQYSEKSEEYGFHTSICLTPM